jgi:hypothetical protein
MKEATTSAVADQTNPHRLAAHAVAPVAIMALIDESGSRSAADASLPPAASIVLPVNSVPLRCRSSHLLTAAEINYRG